MNGAVVHRFLRRHVRVMGSVLSVDTTEPAVVLTYDDGPDPDQTIRVLDALSSHGATATFFMLSARALRHPSLVRDVLSAGHEVALHGPDHRPLSAFSPREITSRTVRAREDLESVAGRDVRWMRPPYGRQSPAAYLALRRAGVMPVLWGATNFDSAPVDESARLAAANKVEAGSILLCHDGRAGLEDGVDDGDIPWFDRGALTNRMLDQFARRGLRGVSLKEALASGRPRRGAWFA